MYLIDWLRLQFQSFRFSSVIHSIDVTMLISLSILLFSSMTTAGESEAQISLSKLHIKKLNSCGHESQMLHERSARFSLGSISYSISYRAGYDAKKPGCAFPLEGYIGMPQPSRCNWYQGGFLWVLLDGQDIGKTAFSSMVVSETGERGILDLVWHHELADVRVRFLGLPGSDHLFAEISIDAKRKLKKVTVKLRCYPSFFTAYFKREGARRIQTPSSLVMQE